MDAEGVVGVQQVSTGARGPIRRGFTGEVMVSAATARNLEGVMLGRRYVAGNDPATAPISPGTTFGTAAALALYNPKGNGVSLAILAASLGYLGGTLPVGGLFYGINTDVVAPAGTPITPQALLVGRGAGVTARAFHSATLPEAPTVLRPFVSLAPMLATSVLAPWSFRDEVDGAIVLMPGAILSILAVASGGSSPLVALSIEWEEIPSRA